MSDSKSPQVSSINNAIVWIVFSRPLISKPSSPCTNTFVTLPNAPITIRITIISMFHSVIFSSLAMSCNLSLFSLSFGFTVWSAETAKSTIQQVFFLTIARYYYYYYYCFSQLHSLMVFHWSASGSKFLLVSRSCLSILAVFNNAVSGYSQFFFWFSVLLVAFTSL